MKSPEVMKAVIEEVGTKEVAADLKVSTSLVYKWCAEPPTESGHETAGARNPMGRLNQLFESTGDRRPIDWLCERAGGFFVPRIETEPDTISKVYVSHTRKLLSEFSQLLQTVTDSMAHEDRIDASESDRIRAKWQALQSCAEAFVQACERGSFNPKEQRGGASKALFG